MAYVGESYRLYYIAKDFKTNLFDVMMVVYKPNGIKQGVYILTELNLGDGKGIYYYDYEDSDIEGCYLFIINSLSYPKKDAHSVFFITPLAEEVDTGINMKQALKIILSILAGKSTGGGTSTITFKNITSEDTIVTSTVDSNGNRLNVITNV